MFGLRRKKPRAVRPTIQLKLEALESRYCPAGPTITNFQAVVLGPGSKAVLLEGTVNAVPATIAFTGEAQGQTTANADGSFSLQVNAMALGTVMAQATANGQSGNQASSVLSWALPTLDSLGVTATGSTKQITVTGHTSVGAGQQIIISNVASGFPTTATGGYFSWTGNATSLGTIDITAIDVWLQQGSSEVTLAVPAPVISNFSGENTGVQNIWDFEGQVTAGNLSTAGYPVVFSGVPALQGVLVTVGTDGWFHESVQLSSTDVGLLVAYTSDIWGQYGEAEFLV